MANSQKPARFSGINGSATLGSNPDQSGFAGGFERLLEIFRVAIRYVSTDLDSAPTGAAPEHSSEHLDESLLSGEAAGSETLSLSREIDTCRQIV
jgi:hypothetical protein